MPSEKPTANHSLGDVVILGGAGFLGSHLVELLHETTDSQIIVIDNFDETLNSATARRKWAQEILNRDRVQLIEADMADELSIRKCVGADVVVNLAAIAGLRTSWQYPARVFETNFLKFHTLVSALESLPTPPYLIHASTSSVYGRNAQGKENSPKNPVSPYGHSKLAAEYRLFGLKASSVLDWSILRFFSIYGPRQREDMAYHRVISAALNGHDFTVFGNGSQSRTNTYVGDAANAIVATLNRRPHRLVFNIANQELTPLMEAIKQVERLSKKTVSLKYQEQVPGDQDITNANTSKALEILGWKAITSLETGLKQQIAFQLRNR